MKNYNPPNSKFWDGRKSEEASYWFGNIRFDDLSISNIKKDSSISILGYACDEGVRRNQGRVGAAEGPNSIRRATSSMAWHLEEHKVYDCGNILCLEANMEKSQESLALAVDQILSAGSFPIVLGGGHDMAYGHYNGIRKFMDRNEGFDKIGIINFDAHFDLREVTDIGNSGTPFFQISQDEMAIGRQIQYLPIGIQKEANIVGLFKTADRLQVDYIENDEVRNNCYSKVDSFIANCELLYISLDLDIFSSAYAPGVSAPSPMGCSPNEVIALLTLIMKSKKVVSMDIAEMNPLYDQDGLTAKLASRIIALIANSYFDNHFK